MKHYKPMGEVNDYIASGILELYVLGLSTPAENTEVEMMLELHPLIRKEIDDISLALENYGQISTITPDPTIKPFLLAVTDYTQRLAQGELPASPPLLTDESTITDYAAWIDRKDMVLPPDFTEFHAKIIGYTPAATTAIVWLKTGAPEETHQHQLERFLVLEGSCNIVIEGIVHSLVPGDLLSIPLHKKHYVEITSTIPCKIILQRMAA